ncbi:hypothetical protein DSLASN_47060 [Desulfoluna limicola]|uniref:Solute-binding protein family 3/N-terminal domain-containing protein n=1 Tax=Desulfoluna limicola TaxID=2810562 RepID=A0ABM7PNF8_9BACT|nr:transporter substrate-binding domain-containing protein [Desulfoluna limicola]BCS99074.1 hypothetical protein DSLASN_47060 [Desulfoluna limicola]
MKQIVVILLVLGLCPSAYSESLDLIYFQTGNRYDYRIDLLKLAMDKTVESDGPYSIKPVAEKMTQSRGIDFLGKGERVNVGFFPTNKERELRFLSVKIPLLRGLLGYRVSLIRRGDLEGFSRIESLDQLRQRYLAGFGSQWADMKILQGNSIPVVGAAKYENLFKMLMRKRFDYFPRGINEAWDEASDKKEAYPDLVVDPYIALYYPYPVYFFVNKKDVALADRIERGLSAALEDGSFKALFMRYHKAIIQQADLKNRKLFLLNNSTLAEGTAHPDTEWWLERH